MNTTLLTLTVLLTCLADEPARKSSPFARWEKAIAAMEKRDRVNPPPDRAVFFCGSSSIVQWKLDKSFPDLKVVNRGFGGSQIPDSTHFAPRILLPYNPSAIVLYAGDNDIAAGKKADRVHEDFRAFVKVVRAKLSTTPIYFLSIKPSIRRWKLIETIRQANALIEAECKKGKHLVYVDVATPMLGKDGMPRKELFVKDGLHLSAAGYELWTKVLREHLKKPRSAAPAAQPVEVEIASAGKARLSIVVSKDASAKVKQAARTLSDYLGRITGAGFKVTSGDGRTGLAVGKQSDFAALGLAPLQGGKDPTRREDYLLESHSRGIYVLGTTDLAVEHAVWDLLYRLGYRQFFPGPTWEIVPRSPQLRIAVSTREHPSYHSRRIWFGYGAGPWAVKHYADWCARNRATAGIALNTGHAYDGILRRNKAEFDRHPEYLGLLDGKRKSSKFCISNPELRKLVCADALRQFAAEPERDSVSVDPSDGGGWCECPRCQAMGSVSDRALTLANEVAETVSRKYPGKYVGMYAYSQHSPPPSIRVHPNVIISVATAYITGGYSLDELMTGWQKQGATLGVREYFSVNVWDRDLPGKPRASRLAYLQQTIPHFHALGARFFSAESSDNWGPCGLGYYLAARMLWDINESKQIDHLRADFLTRAFGSAREPIDRFYKLIDGDNRPLLTDDLVGRMYRHLAEARKQTDDEHILARIADLVLYTRYVELWLDYASASGDARQKAFETMLRHAYRMRSTQMIHVLGLARDLPNRDKSIRLMANAGPRVPASKNPWMSDEPFRPVEIDAIVAKGIETRQTYRFTPRSFSDELVPATPLKLKDGKPGTMGLYSRGTRTYWTWIEKAPAKLDFIVQAGRIYTNRGSAKLALFPSAETQGKAVAEASIAPDRKEHAVSLATTFTGLHRMEVSDHAAGTVLRCPQGRALTVISSPEQPATFHGRWSLYFYVPKGTREVGGYASGVGTMLDGSGKVVHTFAARPGYFSVPVPAGQDGQLWKMDRCVGQRLLMTVPPCFAASAGELLLPAEVVKKDGR